MVEAGHLLGLTLLLPAFCVLVAGAGLLSIKFLMKQRQKRKSIQNQVDWHNTLRARIVEWNSQQKTCK